MFATGLLMAAIFGYRLAIGLAEPTWGWHQLYLLGGLIIAGLLFKGAIAERQQTKQDR